MSPRDILVALLPPLFWGIGFTFAKPAVGHFPPVFMMSLVYLATAIFMYRPRPRMRTPWWVLFAIAALGLSVQNALIFTGLKAVPAATASLVVQSQVPFAVIAAAVFGKEALNYLRVLGMAVALAGLVLVAGAPEAAGDIVSLLLIVAGAALWGVAQVLIRVLGRDDGRRIAGAICLWAAPQSFLLSLPFEGGQWASVTTAGLDSWIALAILILCGYVLAYTFWYRLLQRHRIDQITPFILLMPIVSVFLSWLLLGEAVSWMTLAGGAVVLGGVAIVIAAPAERKESAAGPAPCPEPLPAED